MKRSVKLYIKDILEYMGRAEEHIKGLGFMMNSLMIARLVMLL